MGIVVRGRREAGKFERPIAVFYHTPYRTLHNLTNEPLGPTIMRQRHLRSSGFDVVNIWASLWDKLDEDGRMAFLKMKISDVQSSSQECPLPTNAGGGNNPG